MFTHAMHCNKVPSKSETEFPPKRGKKASKASNIRYNLFQPKCPNSAKKLAMPLI